jgi:hypothetical protein
LLVAGPWCWTPLFVLFDLGLATEPHKPVLKIATMQLRVAANRKNPFQNALRAGRTFQPSRVRHRPRAAR